MESDSTIGHYRIVGPLGAGGMGEVYRAHDPRLDRSVALKILPPDVVRNEERVRRFILEAKSASSLNHPHIVTIYEIGQAPVTAADGSADGPPIHYIAMELIEGSTLRRKIHEDAVDLHTLLGYLAQAAEGLAKAHGAGIVHRDLKPENIMVTRDGFAKVLDFGLAKLSVKKTAPEGNTQTAVMRDETREGTLLGTVAYMSPEQVQGKAADHRSDIFSFGAILYEAATRQRPFEADSDVDLMHKILHDKPPPIDEINPEVPAELRRMIRRCLAKDPEKRFQSMKDLALELGEIVDEFEELSVHSSTPASRTATTLSGEVTAQRAPRTLWLAGIVIALLAIGGVAFGVVQWRSARATKPSPIDFSSMRMERLTSAGSAMWAAISPDGKYVAHVVRDETGMHSLHLRQISTGTDVEIVAPVPTGFTGVTFSPEGDYVYYSNRDTAEGPAFSWLFRIPTLGGQSQKVLFDVDTPVTFSPDGKQLAFARGVPQSQEIHLIVAKLDGSGERALAKVKQFNPPVGPTWSPDGKTIAMGVIEVRPNWHGKIYGFDVATGTKQLIGNGKWFNVGQTRWLPDGSAIVMTATAMDSGRAQIWLQPASGEPAIRVTNDLNEYWKLSLSADAHTLVAIQRENSGDLMIAAPSDESGGVRLTRTPNQRPLSVVASRAGPVVYGFESGSMANVGVIDAPGAAPRVITTDGQSFDPTITADGKTVVFMSERIDGTPHIFAVDADGSNLRQLTRGAMEFEPSISADGRTLLYSSDRTLWVQSLDGGGQPRKLSDLRNGIATIAPDGRSCAFLELARENGRLVQTLKVLTLDGSRPILDIEFQAGTMLRYHPRGEGITFRKEIGGVDNIFLQPFSGAAPIQLTRFRKGSINSYDWTADGKLVLSRGEPRSDVVMIRDFRTGK